MRRLILLGLVTAMALPATGARRVTVAQLEEALAADYASRRSDLDVARQVGTFEMTQRLTDNTLNRFAGTLKLGPKAAVALQLLSDQSTFLAPPGNELPATAPPDTETQHKMVDAARAYAVQTWSRMPNFFVTRVTNRFDNGPHVLAQGDWPVDLGLQPTGRTSREVTFRDGKEVLDSGGSGSGQQTPQELGLRSWGEFGPALSVVLGDTAQHAVSFSHWEKAGTRLAAVFTYLVPREASHYEVTYRYRSETVIGRTQFGYSGRDRTAQQVANIPRETAYQTYREKPAYHGTISIDPATGAVMRLTIQAELSGADPLLLAETMVQYGPVTIGDRQFICPVRSLAISSTGRGVGASGASMPPNGVDDRSLWASTTAPPGKSSLLLINETTFGDYHRLGSTARILTDAAGGGAMSPAASNGPEASQGENGPVAESALPPPNPQPDERRVAANSAPPLPAAPPAALPPPAPAEPVIPEVSMAPATALPDRPGNLTETNESSYSLKVTSRLVDVGLVAYDKKGHPVDDLKAGDIELYDDGRKQEIRSFNLATVSAEPTTTQASQSGAPSEGAEPAFSNRVSDAGASPASAPSAADIGSTILVIDESHIGWNDMNLARGQILKFLNSLAAGERVGLYSMNGLGFRVLTEVTTDHAALIARMQKFMPNAQSVSAAQEEETRNRQQFDEVHNVTDLNSVNGNHIDVADGMTPIDPQLMTMGDDPARAAFVILTQVARHLASIPGHKKVVWVSSDNVLASWEDQTVGIEKSPKDERGFAMRVEETMNDAHAAVYPFDVSQLEGGAITADMQHRNVELTQAASDTASLPGASPPSRNMTGGRISAEMSQDLHPVQGPVREVAAATGGRVIRRSGDLAAQLDGIVADGHATYMLSFSPQTSPDDQYHTINIKLTGRRGLTLRYRTGYLFEKEATTLKQRFQQAVWRPADVSEIAVTANVEPVDPGADVKINIAAGDLGLQQQAGRWMDKLDIFFIQRDDAGLHAQVEGQTLGLRLKSSTYERLLPTGVPFSHFVAMKRGMASLRVLVVDENSGRMGSVTIPASSLRVGQ